MEQHTQHEENRPGPGSSRRLFLLASLTLLILAGILGTIFAPRLWRHPSLLSTRTVQGTFIPLWSDDHTVVLTKWGTTAYIWNLSTNTLTKGHPGGCVVQDNGLESSTGLYWICSYYDTGTILVFDQLTGAQTVNYNDHRNHFWVNYTLSNDGTKAAFVSDQQVFQVWDLQTGKIQLTLQLPPSSQPVAIAWSPDEQKLAVHYTGQGIEIWDLAEKRLSSTLTGPDATDKGGELDWSSNSARLGYAAETYEKTQVDIWEASTGKLVLAHQSGPLFAGGLIQLLAGGQSFLITGENYDHFVLVSAATGRTLLDQTMPFMSSFQISPDTNLLELANGKTIEIYDAFTGQKVATYAGLVGGYSLGSTPVGTPSAMLGGWSPDSQSIASAGQDARLHVWNARTGQDRTSYHLQMAFPSAVTWSQNGSMIAVSTSTGNAGTPVSALTSIQGIVSIVSAP